MDPSAELSSRLADYLRRRTTLDELEAWLAPRLTLFLTAPDSHAGRLAGAIELSVAELRDGLKTERSVRKGLRRYRCALDEAWLVLAEDALQIVTSTNASEPIVGADLWSQTRIWHIEPVEATV